MDFCVEWLNHLLNSLDENCDSCLFENCAKLHYQRKLSPAYPHIPRHNETFFCGHFLSKILFQSFLCQFWKAFHRDLRHIWFLHQYTNYQCFSFLKQAFFQWKKQFYYGDMLVTVSFPCSEITLWNKDTLEKTRDVFLS